MQYVYAVVFFVLGMVLNTISASGQICPQASPTFPQEVMDMSAELKRSPHTRSMPDRNRTVYENTYASAAWWKNSSDGCEEMTHSVGLYVDPDGWGYLTVSGNGRNNCQGTWFQYHGSTNDLSASFVDFKTGEAHIEIQDLAVDVTWGDQSSQQMGQSLRSIEVSLRRTSARIGRNRSSSFWSHPSGETYKYSSRGSWVEASADGVILEDLIVLESGDASIATIGMFTNKSRRLR